LAENWQLGSAGHERQFTAFPASAGFLEGLKWTKEPEEVTVKGKCGGSLGSAGEQSNQRRRSISWQDFVRRDGALVDELRQLPLREFRMRFL